MKKICMVCFVIAILALAGCEDQMNPRDVTVNEAKGLTDGTLVRLTGNIESTAVAEIYRFSDNAGNTITAEIDSEVWARSGINLTILAFPVKAEIEGEVDKERGSEAYIDVTRVKILS